MAAIFMVLALGVWSFSACSSDDLVKSLVDIEFDEDATIELDEVTAEKTATVNALAAGDECGTASVSTALQALESTIDNLDIVDIENVDLNYVDVEYTASWTPSTVTTLTCQVTITGITNPEQSTTLQETAINSTSGSQRLTLSTDQIGVINYYLDNRDASFEYCLVCDNDELIETYTVTYNIDLNINIRGSI